MSKKYSNLSYQICESVRANFKEGTDKHSYKIVNGAKKDSKVFSYSQRNNLIGIGKQLGRYIQRYYPDIRYVKEIDSEHINAFMASKSDCSGSTIVNYANNISKLNYCLNDYYVSCNKKWNIRRIQGKQKQYRNIAFTREELEEILNSKPNTSYGWKGVKIAMMTGARAEDIVTMRGKDIHLNTKKITIYKSKNGRTWDIELLTEDLEQWSNFKKEVNDNDRIVPIRPDSLNAWLRRACISINITRYKEAKTGIHAIRKMVAQEHYDRFRKNGIRREEALDLVEKHLGHGIGRTELHEIYVLDQW